MSDTDFGTDFYGADQKLINKSLSVVNRLLIQPDIRSKTIAEQMGIDKNELIQIYNFISKHDTLRNLLRYNSKYPEYTIPMFDCIRNKKQIGKIITGQFAPPLIVEIHLGEECNHSCVMCFSNSVEYEEREDNQKHRILNEIIPTLEQLLNSDGDDALEDRIFNKLKKLNKHNAPFLKSGILKEKLWTATGFEVK